MEAETWYTNVGCAIEVYRDVLEGDDDVLVVLPNGRQVPFRAARSRHLAYGKALTLADSGAGPDITIYSYDPTTTRCECGAPWGTRDGRSGYTCALR